MKKYNAKNLVVKNNQLIESQYKLTLQEQKLVLSIISMIEPDDKKFQEYRLSVKEFIKLTNIEGKDYYSRIIKFSKSLLKKPIVIMKKNDTKMIANWFSTIDEIEKGVWAFSFDPKLKPYLLKLKQQFTNYQLKNVIRLSSKYSIRLYEILKQYSSIGERVVGLNEFRLMLGIEKNQYYKFSGFKNKVLEKAKNELSKKTDIEFTWKSVKTGRKITGIHFFIQKNKDKKIKNIEVQKDNKRIELNKIKELINLLPERYKVKQPVVKLIEKYIKLRGTEYVKKHIEYANIKAKKNYTVFLKRSLSENWDIEEIEEIKQVRKKKQKEYEKEIAILKKYEDRRLLKIKIVENLIPDIEQGLRDYIYVQKNKKPVSHDKQKKRLKYKKGVLVMFLMSYLKLIVQEYIKENNSVTIDDVMEWFEEYTGIKEVEILNSIIQYIKKVLFNSN